MTRAAHRGWRHRLPITAQVLLLAMVVVAVAQAISFAVIVLTPVPPAPRMTLAAARNMLAGRADADEPALTRTVSAEPPLPASAASAAVFGAVLAYGLGVEPARVRMRQFAGGNENAVDPRSLVITAPRQGRPSARLRAISVAPLTVTPDVARLLLSSGFRLPAFEAAWQRPDGRWVAVKPRSPWIADWRVRLAISLTLGLALAGPIAWLAARNLTKPIRALAGAADATRLSRRPLIPDDGPPETRAAANALAAMHNRLEDQFAERMRMLVAIAHDLRTPLTALRLRIEGKEDVERERQVALVDRMERMVSEVLSYATSTRPEALELTDVAALVRDQLAQAGAGGAPIPFTGPATAMLRLPPTKVSRIIANLVDNAVRYAADVEVAMTLSDRAVQVAVLDRGPGVASADLERIMEPFARVEGSRSRQTGGVGLGLTIARELASELGGSLDLSHREGGGLVATVKLVSDG